MAKSEKQQVIDVVDIGSSDDDETVVVEKTNAPSNQPALRTGVEKRSSRPSLESRSFWKAGGYEIGPTKFVPVSGQLEHARVHPKFLHSNATSHKWAFGAIAELLDNAVDEICNGATFVKVDKISNVRDNSPALLFQDDGGGMDPESIRKCMSLGYSSKKSNTTIGQYGNGFKTSTMRLGADVIVFSRASSKGRATQSVGLLSYTFLRKTGQDDVIVPMVDFDVSNHWAEPIIYSSLDDWSSNLKTILEWSPFATKEELMSQFEDIGTHGTKIVIFNLWLNDEGIYELNFDDDEEDIQLRDETNRGGSSRGRKRLVEPQSHISYNLRYSLRAYTSILYLRKFTGFKIIIRGKPVEQMFIADELKHSVVVVYRPQLALGSKEVSVSTTIGFIQEAPALAVSGFNVYHKNRLIRPFWSVTSEGSSRGKGVVGVLEANFIEPAHDKQDFERSTLFIRLEMKLTKMLMEYWKTHAHFIGIHTPVSGVQNLEKQSSFEPVINQKQMPTPQHVIGLSRGTQQEVHLDQPIVGLAANMSSARAPPFRGPNTSFQKEQPAVVGLAATRNPAVVGLAAICEGSIKDVASGNSQGSISVDQICEENIQLFMRCEEHVQKENQLKQTIEELEKELEEAKKKRAQLASHVENQRKQRILKQQTEKVL